VTVVVDGSALAIAVIDTTDRGDRVLARLEAGAVAPHLVDAEVGQAIRGLVLRGLLVVDDAEASLAAAEELVVERFPHPPLRSRAWQLRSNVSFYDGLYVALAEALQLPLLTADVKLVGATGPRCHLEAV
jgi:predicted nucleic acid-binding protein